MSVTMTFKKPAAWLVAIGLAAIGAGGCKDLPTTTSPPTTATLTFASQLAVRGFTSRSFTTAKAGDAKVVFVSMAPDNTSAITISLGTWNGTKCTPTATVNATGGGSDPVISSTVVAGTSCISVADPGVLTKTNDFYITITYPAGS